MNYDVLQDLFTTENYSQKRVNKDLEKILVLSLLTAISKGNYYNDSWCKRGIFSISQNLERKWNRIENIIFGTKNNPGLLQGNIEIFNNSENIIDTLLDLGIYCFLAVVWFKQKSSNFKNKFYVEENDNIFLLKEENIIGDAFRKFLHNQIDYISKSFPSNIDLNSLFDFNKSENIKTLLEYLEVEDEK